MTRVLSSRKLQRWSASAVEFEAQECGGGGDCLFHVLAAALNNLFGMHTTMQDLRDALARSITTENVRRFVRQVREDQKLKMLPGTIDIRRVLRPTWCETMERTRVLVRRPGVSFQGTDMVLHWLGKYDQLFHEFKIGFVCFNGYGPGYVQRFGGVSTDIYILLYNHFDTHWQLASLSLHPFHSAISRAECDKLFRDLSVS